MPTINRPRPHYPIPIICTECEKAIAGEYFFFHKRIICQICFQQKCRTKIDQANRMDRLIAEAEDTFRNDITGRY